MYVLYSISFSVPRCSSPICGSARSTISPSSSRISRSTPCAAGCCGPKFIEWLSICTDLPDWVTSVTRVSLMILAFRLFRALCEDLLVARQRGDRFPWRQKIEAAEILGQAHRFIDNLLSALFVAEL